MTEVADEEVATFMYALGQKVRIEASGESGTVIGRAEYLTAEPTYLVRYRAADGRATEAWWAQTALTCE